MAFIDSAKLKKRENDAPESKHPLLKDADVPQTVRRAYLQGCVACAFEEDSSLSEDSARRAQKLGRLLGIPKDTVIDDISALTGMSGQEDRLQFLHETLDILKDSGCGCRFLFDCACFGRASSCGKSLEYVDLVIWFVEHGLIKEPDWCRVVLTALDESEKGAWQECCKDFCAKGVPSAKVLVAHDLLTSAISREGRVSALKLLSEAADRGDIGAAHEVGRIYYEGEVTAKDAKQGFAYSIIAAKAGVAESQYLIGRDLLLGLSREADTTEAVVWLRKAHEGGWEPAGAELGECYLSGKGCGMDKRKGFALIHEAGKKGNVRAEFLIALWYKNGDGVKADENESYRWAAKASDHGCAPATNLVGVFEAECTAEKARKERGSTEGAEALFVRAAEAGVVEAEFNLGVCYDDGEHYEKTGPMEMSRPDGWGRGSSEWNEHKDKALTWFRRAAEHGNRPAELQVRRLESCRTEFRVVAKTKELKGVFEKITIVMLGIIVVAVFCAIGFWSALLTFFALGLLFGFVDDNLSEPLARSIARSCCNDDEGK